jgi:hypothetical protein
MARPRIAVCTPKQAWRDFVRQRNYCRDPPSASGAGRAAWRTGGGTGSTTQRRSIDGASPDQRADLLFSKPTYRRRPTLSFNPITSTSRIRDVPSIRAGTRALVRAAHGDRTPSPDPPRRPARRRGAYSCSGRRIGTPRFSGWSRRRRASCCLVIEPAGQCRSSCTTSPCDESCGALSCCSSRRAYFVTLDEAPSSRILRLRNCT